MSFSIIKRVGKYNTRRSSKIAEVTDIRGGLAIGWVGGEHLGWNCVDGKAEHYPHDDFDIISPYLEPSRPLECWVNVKADGAWRFHRTKLYAEGEGGLDILHRAVHMVEVKE